MLLILEAMVILKLHCNHMHTFNVTFEPDWSTLRLQKVKVPISLGQGTQHN